MSSEGDGCSEGQRPATEPIRSPPRSRVDFSLRSQVNRRPARPPRLARSRPDSLPYRGTNIFRSLVLRESGKNRRTEHHLDLRKFAEYQLEAGVAFVRTLPTPEKTTVAISFSSQGNLVASTHGDHGVRVFHHPSGELLQTLYGHPRTPWNVKFHPHRNSIVATSCIGNQIRVWNVQTGMQVACKVMSTETQRPCLSSFCFHPLGHLIFICFGTGFYVWRWEDDSGQGVGESDYFRCLDFPRHRRSLVKFTPGARYMIIGKNLQRPNENPRHSVQVYHFNDLTLTPVEPPVFVVDNVHYHHEGGSIAVSRCHRYMVLAAREGDNLFLCVYSMEASNAGELLTRVSISSHRHTLTSLSVSPCCRYVLLGFGGQVPRLQRRYPVELRYMSTLGVVESFRYRDMPNPGPHGSTTTNAAQFHPQPGWGFVYASNKGPMYMILANDCDETQATIQSTAGRPQQSPPVPMITG